MQAIVLHNYNNYCKSLISFFTPKLQWVTQKKKISCVYKSFLLARFWVFVKAGCALQLNFTNVSLVSTDPLRFVS